MGRRAKGWLICPKRAKGNFVPYYILVATFKLLLTRERANWVWRQDHESGIVDAILSYQLFDQQVTEICFSLRIELEKQVKKKKKKKTFYQWFKEIP